MEELIVVFKHKRNVGISCIPYFAEDEEDKTIALIEHATRRHIQASPDKFDNKQIELIKLLSTISDQHLRKKFAPSENLKSFINNLPSHKYFNSQIRVFIDKTIYKAVTILAESKIKAYYQNGNFSKLYQTDLLKIPRVPAQAIFNFEIEEDILKYTLSIRQPTLKGKSDKDFSLFGRDVEFFTQENAVFKIDNKLFYFENIDSQKFKPFTKQSAIYIKSKQMDQYMDSFVRNCIRNYKVHNSGFNIETIKQLSGPHLSIINDLKAMPVIGLYFKYPNRKFIADTKAPVFVDLNKENNSYNFQKIIRDFDFENQLKNFLSERGLRNSGDALFYPSRIFSVEERPMALSAIVNWLIDYYDELTDRGFSIDETYDNYTLFIGPISLSIDKKEDKDWFELNIIAELGEFKIPLTKFRKHLISNDPEYKLPDGRIFMIPPNWFNRYNELFYFGKLEKNIIKLPLSHFQLVEQIKSGDIGVKKEEINFLNYDVELPQGLQAKLRPYQIQGYRWLACLNDNNYGGILADDMGLGKTLQTIALLQKIYQSDTYKSQTVDSAVPIDKSEPDNSKFRQLSLFDSANTKSFNNSGIAPSLIVMPTSLLHNWQNEFKKFTPILQIYNYSGTNRLRTKDIGKIFRHYHVVLTSYGVLRNDIEILQNYRFCYFILDESQYIKNPTSKVYQAVKSIQSSYKLTLTGTPIENSLIDLWAQMNFVNKGLLGSQSFFKRQFVVPINRNKDEEKKERLQKLIQPFILRRTKDKVAKDLPPLMEQVVYCEMSPDQKKLYESEKSGIRNTIYKIFEEKPNEQSSLLTIQALTRLRQIANHPAMIDQNYKGTSGKFEQVLDNLESVVAEGHNVLVFSSFVKDLELVEYELINRQLPYVKLTGATRERSKVIDEFNIRASVFLISLKAGGVGLNLTKADYVFMLNPWWNPAAEIQAISRAHRIGQTKNVFVYRFLSSGTIEEKIARLQERKMELADDFINNNNLLMKMSREEILELFS